MKRLRLIFLAILLLLPSIGVNAQFKDAPFTQSYSDSPDSLGRDTTNALFSFSEYFGGVFHKRDSRISVMFMGSTVFVGFEQIQNRQYWKLPLVYGGLAGTIGTGVYFRHQWKTTGQDNYLRYSQWCFWGAGLVYWATLMDGVYNYKRDLPHQPGKATLYSLLLPGLGQAYNGEYWKIPLYYGLMLGAANYMVINNRNYQRYRMIYSQVSDPESGVTVMSAEGAKSYRDIFRRYRDYSIVILAAVYLLQVIDANVFSYMRDFELNDNLSMNVTPTVITDSPVYAMNTANTSLHYSAGAGQTGFGLKVGFRF